jgi:hypothetical protein
VSAQAPLLTADVSADFVNSIRRQVREPAVLEVAPQQLDGVEIGSVGREPDNGPPGVSREPGADAGVLVRVAAIPHEDDGPAHVPSEMAEKPEDLRPADVEPGIQRQGQRDLPPARRDDERANAGDLLVGSRAYGERGGDAARGPRAAKHGHHQETRLIEADQVGALSPEFFLPRPSPGGSTRARDDRRAPWRAAGGAAD